MPLTCCFSGFAQRVYHLLQLGAYTLMAVLIMRLKLFWTPQLCLVSCYAASWTVLASDLDSDSDGL